MLCTDEFVESVVLRLGRVRRTRSAVDSFKKKTPDSIRFPSQNPDSYSFNLEHFYFTELTERLGAFLRTVAEAC